MSTSDRFDIDSIAVIGAGPAGLAAAKYLIAEKKFSKITVFEQRPNVGGVWNYTPNTTLDINFTIPRTKPSNVAEKPVFEGGQKEPIFVSPVYDYLETNIPHNLMNYSDQPFPANSSLFPSHKVVKKYLEDYAVELAPYIRLHTQTLEVVPATSDKKEAWSVTTRDIISNEETTEVFDAVVCANGHYSDPFIPAIPGLQEFNQRYPHIISHSKYYRLPNDYKDKKVIVVGNSASGVDISAQISLISKGPVLVSEKVVPEKKENENVNIEELPEIDEFLVEERGVRFANGRVERDIDSVVFCTGYQYSFPFLKQLSPPLVTTGQRTENVYEHILYNARPTLAFLTLPQRIVPLPVAEAQSAWIARIFSGRLPCPSQQTMVDWESNLIALKGNGKFFHNLAFPQDAAYINRLHDWSLEADLNPELPNEGKGKIPPYWGKEKQWIRERFPLIKLASRALGERRHEVHSLEELGFDFKKWKAEEEEKSRNAADSIINIEKTSQEKSGDIQVATISLSA